MNVRRLLVVRRLETRVPLPDVVVSQVQKELSESEINKPPASEEESDAAIRYLALRTAPSVCANPCFAKR